MSESGAKGKKFQVWAASEDEGRLRFMYRDSSRIACRAWADENLPRENVLVAHIHGGFPFEVWSRNPISPPTKTPMKMHSGTLTECEAFVAGAIAYGPGAVPERFEIRPVEVDGASNKRCSETGWG